jgi:L-ascorbate peroxidase
VLHDAATYDVNTGKGGINGSIVLSEELNRKENSGLKSYVDKLAKAKKAIDSKSATVGQGAISWADLEVLAVKVAMTLGWVAIKVKRSSIASGGTVIADAFGAAWPVSLGRLDATEPDAPVSIPSDDASPEEVKAFFDKLGNPKAGQKAGFGGGKAPFWERPAFLIWAAAQDNMQAAEQSLAADSDFAGWKKKYDRSRATVTRTEYEVDFIDFFTRLANLGANIDREAYLYPVTLNLPKIS